MIIPEAIIVSCSFILLALIQSIALTPLLKLNIHSTFIFIVSPGFLLITASLTYYFYSAIVFFGPTFLIFFVVGVLFFEFIILSILVNILKKRNIHVSDYLYTKIPWTHIIFLFIFSFLIFFFFIQLYPPSFTIYSSGDGVGLSKLVQDLASFKQRPFSHTYYNSIKGNSEIGLFYPWAGFIFSAILVKNFSVSTTSSLIVNVYFFSFFAYPFTVYLLLKVLKVPFLRSLLFLLILVNIFPVGLIFANNFATIFGVVAALVLLCIFSLLSTYLFNYEKLIFIFLSILILFPLHPSSIISFILFLISTQLLFKEKLEFKKLILKKTNTIIIIILFISFTISLYITSPQLKTLFNAFLNAQPNYFSWEIFIQGTPLVERIILFTWTNIVSLSYYSYSIPFALFILVIMVYSRIKFKKDNYYIVPLLLYIILIAASSISGISNFFEFISIISLPFYQSPLRITHFGVIIYILYVALFLKDLQIRKCVLEINKGL